jgi:hypothetical protein
MIYLSCTPLGTGAKARRNGGDPRGGRASRHPQGLHTRRRSPCAYLNGPFEEKERERNKFLCDEQEIRWGKGKHQTIEGFRCCGSSRSRRPGAGPRGRREAYSLAVKWCSEIKSAFPISCTLRSPKQNNAKLPDFFISIQFSLPMAQYATYLEAERA